jgi:hypothetical protein
MTPRRSGPQRVGLILTGLLNASNIASVAFPTPEGEVGPPLPILVFGTLLGLVGTTATVVAWRSGSSRALRLALGCLIVTALTALPAFFVDVAAGIKLVTAISVLLSVAAVVLSLSGPRVTGEVRA